MQLITLGFLLVAASSSFGSSVLQSLVTKYPSWKATEDRLQKNCAQDGAKLSTSAADPKTMVGSAIRNQRQMHIPTALMFKSTLDRDTASKLDAIDRVAKARAMEILKASKKFPLELAQKSSGLGLTREADLTPEDFLQNFDYIKSCQCLHNTQNVARDEAEYNQLTVQEFLLRTEHNKAKCFVQSASL